MSNGEKVTLSTIMKTDIAGFTERSGRLSLSELSTLLQEHKKIAVAIFERHEGKVVKGEGDAFWVLFPSVTAAVSAAIELQDRLVNEQAGQGISVRLAVRAAISVGDILHQDGDIFGDAVNLAARIESVTPVEAIYISHAAKLALKRSEHRAPLVDAFIFKGFSEAEQVYRIEQVPRIRVIDGLFVLFTDIIGFTAFYRAASLERTEIVLASWHALHQRIAEACKGTIRMALGDGFFLTFLRASDALTFHSMLADEWARFLAREGFGRAPLFRAGMHVGRFNQFREMVFGSVVNMAMKLTQAASQFDSLQRCTLTLSEGVRAELVGTSWAPKLREFTAEKLHAGAPTTRAYALEALDPA